MKQAMQGLLLAGTLVFSGAALAQQQQQQQARPQAAKGGMAEYQGFMVPADQKAFLERMHYINQQEIKLGQLAQRTSRNEDVRSYAQEMVRDHTTADQQLMSYAQRKGIKLTDTPKPMNELERKAMAADKAMMEQLQAMQGQAFDSSYMSSQVGQHDHALGKVMAARQAGFTTDAQLTSMLDEQSRKITQHRERAHELLGKVGPTQAPGVGGAGPGMGGQQGDKPQKKQ